jgi:hypothetical protein
MLADERRAWIDEVTRSYPRIDDLPKLEDYNLLQ